MDTVADVKGQEKKPEVKKEHPQPPWHKPQGTPLAALKVNNSLNKKQLEDFIPAKGKLIKWYTCGPTVYDNSHLGHARNYLTFDILRRIMTEYFGYSVFYVMNITDIDDKIIKRARENHFFAEYAQKNPKLTQEVKDLVLQAWTDGLEAFAKKIAKAEAALLEKKGNKEEKKATLELLQKNEKDARSLREKVEQTAPSVDIDSLPFLNDAKTPISEILDKRHHTELDPEFVKTLCLAHSQYYEKDYFEDMHALGIKDPDVITRVTEYVPAILKMVEKIIERGHAYASEGSVYFNVAHFHGSEGHAYGKLAPESVGDIELLADGEGALGGTGEKQSKKDFALWKATKPGEPYWKSENKFGGSGLGRPGWHIECSAMAGELFGDNMDIHGGGWDLKFPHHDNEMAQSEAYFDNPQWVNYFLHSGHLNIDGLKMSKSLKNFITIKEVLAKFTPIQIRLLFLLQHWDSPMNYQRKDTMTEVNTKIGAFTELFNKVKMLSMETHASIPPEDWKEREITLNNALLQAQDQVHKSLCDNFDTKSVIQHLIDLVTAANTYMTKNNEKKVLLLQTVIQFIKRILGIFGIDFDQQTNTGASGAVNKEEVLYPYVNELVQFRKSVRAAVFEGKKSGEHAQVGNNILKLCDSVRDETMPNLGIKIVDDAEIPFFFADPEKLREEARLKKEGEAEAANKKRLATIDRKKKEIAQWVAARRTPAEVVLERHQLVMDSEAVPKTDASGKEVSKSLNKTATKTWKDQVAANAKYQTALAKNPNFFQELVDEVEALTAQK